MQWPSRFRVRHNRHDTVSAASQPPQNPDACAALPDLETLFTHTIDAGALPTAGVSPRPAVYLLAADQKPILLATTANLKRAIQMRLGAGADPRKTDYAAITTHVRWRYVGSALAASWWYYLAALCLYPANYRSLLSWRAPWFIRISGAGSDGIPSIEITNQLDSADAHAFGPFSARSSARAAADLIIELFDLCRYEEILRKAPHGQACAYKEMGKCPAPCDGSVPLHRYHDAVAEAAALLRHIGPACGPHGDAAEIAWYAASTQEMKRAAVQMEFRQAAKIKHKLEMFSDFLATTPPSWGPADRWKYVCLERGKTRRWVEPWIIEPGAVRRLHPVDAKQVMTDVPAFLDGLWTAPAISQRVPLVDSFALLTYHLNRSRDPGLYLSEGQLSAKAAAA